MKRVLLLFGVLAFAGCKRKDESRGTIDLSPEDAAVVADAGTVAVDAVAARTLTATQLVAAGDASCALLSDHTVRCWKGTGPVTQPDVRAVTEIRMAGDRACALLDDKSVTCWGDAEPHPTGVLGVRNAQHVFVVEGRACAALATGSLVCWGNIDESGHFRAAAKPRQPTPFAGIEHVVALHANAALLEDGTVWSWGADGVPKQRGLEHVVELGTRAGAICGRLESGKVACVGSALPCAPKPPEVKPEPPKPPAKPAPKGKPGKKPAKQSAKAKPPVKPVATPEPVKPSVPVEPVLVLDLPEARSLAFDVGLCVVTAAGKLQCGDGCGKLDAPWKLDRIDEVLGWCARENGRVACWAAPRKVAAIKGIDDATAIAVGEAHACALRAEGSVVCWAKGSTATTAIQF